MKTVLSPSRTKRSLKTCRMVTEVVENYEEVGQSLLGKGARRHREPSRSSWKKILNWFNKNEAIKRYLRSHIVHSVSRSSALENILPFYCRNYLKTRMCRCTPVGITRAKGSAIFFQLYFSIGYVYLFKTRTAKHKKTSQVSVVFCDEICTSCSM